MGGVATLPPWSASEGAPHVQVIGCQTDICWHDKQSNFAAVREFLSGTQIVAPALIVLPEMFATGFSMQVDDIAETATGPANRFLADLADVHGSYVIGGVVARGADGRGRNQAAVYGPGGAELARYDKLHPFSYSQESRHYSGGRDIVLFDCGAWRVAPLVCYDLRFPEIFRRAAQRGATLLVVIANWPAARVAHWTQLLIARAIENQAYVVGVNRAGQDPKLTYPGCSLIVDPRGEIVAQLDDRPGVMTGWLDLAGLEEYRRHFPALADIRPEFLGAPNCDAASGQYKNQRADGRTICACRLSPARCRHPSWLALGMRAAARRPAAHPAPAAGPRAGRCNRSRSRPRARCRSGRGSDAGRGRPAL